LSSSTFSGGSLSPEPKKKFFFYYLGDRYDEAPKRRGLDEIDDFDTGHKNIAEEAVGKVKDLVNRVRHLSSSTFSGGSLSPEPFLVFHYLKIFVHCNDCNPICMLTDVRAYCI
jgi:hypothetical protein